MFTRASYRIEYPVMHLLQEQRRPLLNTRQQVAQEDKRLVFPVLAILTRHDKGPFENAFNATPVRVAA